MYEVRVYDGMEKPYVMVESDLDTADDLAQGFFTFGFEIEIFDTVTNCYLP